MNTLAESLAYTKEVIHTIVNKCLYPGTRSRAFTDFTKLSRLATATFLVEGGIPVTEHQENNTIMATYSAVYSRTSPDEDKHMMFLRYEEGVCGDGWQRVLSTPEGVIVELGDDRRTIESRKITERTVTRSDAELLRAAVIAARPIIEAVQEVKT